MKLLRHLRPDTPFVDTPEGIFTAAGVWFRTRVEALEAYAGAVFAHEPMGRVLAQAELWLRSPQTLTLWLFPLFLFLLDPVPAALAALVVYVGWQTVGPSLVSRVLVRVFQVLDLVLVQAFYYIFMLSVLAAQERYGALWAGLAGFILLRWGLVQWATKPLFQRLWRTLYTLPVPDQVLRALILRAAWHYQVSLPELDQIEQDVLTFIQRKKRRK